MIVVNKNTSGAPMTQAGLTGLQSVAFVPAPRVYIKTVDPLSNTPVQDYYTKSNGTTPTGWTDLGTVSGNVKIQYSKKTNQIRTGIDQIFTAAYASEKTGQLEFMLEQLDDVTLQNITGLSASVITAGSVISYPVGQEDLVQAALLLVVQNKLDGKEWQLYNPAAYLDFKFNQSKDTLSLDCTGLLPPFIAAGSTLQTIMQTTVFA